VSQGVVLLDGNRQTDAFMVNWVTLMASLCWQLMGNHAKAAAILEQLLALPDLDISHRVKGAFSRAFSLYALGRQSEALATYLDLAAELDSLSREQHTLSTRRERQRVRLNIADHYLNACDVDAASYELSALEEEFMTPLMVAARLAAQARVAMMRDQWVEAEQIANRANDAALEVRYIPLRLDALGVLVACAARKNRRDEQHRLVTEMATLLQAK
jgi:tetratricopeptide (TPR) repeat protein